MDILESVTQKQFKRGMTNVRLFLHKSKGYMALFMEESASRWLNELVKLFSDKVYASLGIVKHCNLIIFPIFHSFISTFFIVYCEVKLLLKYCYKY